MKRRDIVKRIGAAGLLVGVSAGTASARSGGTDLDDLTLDELAARDDVTVEDNYCIVDDCNYCPPACEYCIC